ncbi:MAG: RnfABCDGE type electron transport complex subunit D [Bacteroidetes bacterium]|nr:RnfABCDGE type electron transport complex subunit D [Bacteroidota bacterium]
MTTSIWDRNDRLAGLRRFAIAITVLNILGHFFLGFEQSWAQPLVALAAAYGMEILLELVDARLNHRPLRVKPTFRSWADFLLSAHISGLACSMLIYSNEQLWPTAFAAATAIASKALIRLNFPNGQRHILNPSNIGIAMTLLVFPWVGVAQPYQFTENIVGAADWVLPLILIGLGSFLNTRFTKRVPLITAWLAAFALQAVIRAEITDTPILGALAPMTGVAFLLFTFYMVTDPATTPSSPRSQVAFGATVAITYSFLVANHIVFGLFFALAIVCVLRGVGIVLLRSMKKQPVAEKVPEPPRVVRAPVALVQEEAA